MSHHHEHEAFRRVRETLREASHYPASHVWSFRIADVRELLRLAELGRVVSMARVVQGKTPYPEINYVDELRP